MTWMEMAEKITAALDLVNPGQGAMCVPVIRQIGDGKKTPVQRVRVMRFSCNRGAGRKGCFLRQQIELRESAIQGSTIEELAEFIREEMAS